MPLSPVMSLPRSRPQNPPPPIHTSYVISNVQRVTRLYYQLFQKLMRCLRIFESYNAGAFRKLSCLHMCSFSLKTLRQIFTLLEMSLPCLLKVKISSLDASKSKYRLDVFKWIFSINRFGSVECCEVATTVCWQRFDEVIDVAFKRVKRELVDYLRVSLSPLHRLLFFFYLSVLLFSTYYYSCIFFLFYFQYLCACQCLVVAIPSPYFSQPAGHEHESGRGDELCSHTHTRALVDNISIEHYRNIDKYIAPCMPRPYSNNYDGDEKYESDRTTRR